VDLGFESFLAANVNLDLLGLGFRLLGQVNFQQAFVVMGAHLSRIHRAGQSKRASEASVLALDATIVLFLSSFSNLQLAVHGQDVALDA